MTHRTVGAGARRKPASAAARGAAEVATQGLIVASTPEFERLSLLERQHERLLRDIAKRRASLESLRSVANEVLDDVFIRIAPLREEIESTVRELRRLFEGLLERQESNQTRRIVRKVYQEVLAGLPWELLVTTEPQREGADGASEAQESERQPHSNASDDEQCAGAGDYFGPGPDEDAGYSASRPDEDRSPGLSALFKRLVSRLHPDKVQDAQAKAERTSAMKEVTQAYQAGDLARLLEIERGLAEDLLSEVKSDEVAQRVRRLIRANEQLRVQLRALTRERKALRDSLPFHLDLRAPRRLREQAQAQAADIIHEARAELAQFRAMRDFVQRFAAGKMSARDFAAGPWHAAPWDADELLEVVLEELFQQESRPRRSTSGGKRRRRG